jgi:hypothetical protein
MSAERAVNGLENAPTVMMISSQQLRIRNGHISGTGRGCMALPHPGSCGNFAFYPEE